MSLTYIRTALGLTLLALGPLSALACGSDEDGAEGSGSGAASSSGGSNSIDIGGSGGKGGGTGTRNGGSVELTADDVEAIADAACAGWATEGEKLPAVLQLVVDVSGSMDDPSPGTDEDDEISKWDVTRDALRDAIEQLPASVSMGVLYYPNQDTGSSDEARDVDECVNVSERVPIAMLGDESADHRQQIEQSLDDADTGSLTPTHDAYRHALDEGLRPYMTSARKFMLLITDGAPTMRLECIGSFGDNGNEVMDMPTQPIIDDVADAFDDGIRTFLIGSPGSQESSQGGDDMRPWLSRAAMEGGTAADDCEELGPKFCHMDMTQDTDFAQALTNGLASIVGQIVDSCTFAIPTPPEGESLDPSLTNLIINWGSGDASLILPDDTGDCTEGWQFNGDEQIELCADTCERIKDDAGATVQLTFGCSSDEIVPVK